MEEVRGNFRYLPGVEFPDSLHVTTDLPAAIDGAGDVLVVVPSLSFRSTLDAIVATSIRLEGLAWATKGFELGTGKLPHQVAAELLDPAVPTAVLSGPTFAAEVGQGLPSAMTIASSSHDYARRLAESISSRRFRAYTSTDVAGVEIGGATKNVYAIGAGISDGLGFGANTRIALLTRSLAEMTRFGREFGARPETFMGLAGMGDLVLTSTDDKSRNRRFGLAIAAGNSPAAALEDIGQVVEGYYGAKSVHEVAARIDIELPIVEQIYRVLYENLSPRDAVDALMQRPIMSES
jgi:glycerol-3-phosphate dehydrogenase (NAD(P)+)